MKIANVGHGYTVHTNDGVFIGDALTLEEACNLAKDYRPVKWLIWDELYDTPYFLGEVMAFDSPAGAQAAIARMPVGIQSTYSVQNILHVESKISDYLYDRTPF